MPRRWIASLLVTLTAVACGSPLAPTATAPPAGPCEARFSDDRCAAITASVSDQLSVEVDEIVALTIEDEPEPSQPPGVILTRSGSGEVLLAHAGLLDGSVRTVKIFCVGIAPGHDPACMDEPRVATYAIGGDGYRDVPEGSTPLPTLEPAAIADAQPLRIEHRTIDVDHTGWFEVDLGIALIPNGVLTTSDFALADPWPDGVLFGVDGVRLTVSPVDPDGPPFDNLYLRGWREGVEPARVTLEFEVLRVEPGASFDIVDVVVA